MQQDMLDSPDPSVTNGYFDLARLLIDCGADLNAPKGRWTALHAVSAYGCAVSQAFVLLAVDPPDHPYPQNCSLHSPT